MRTPHRWLKRTGPGRYEVVSTDRDHAQRNSSHLNPLFGVIYRGWGDDAEMAVTEIVQGGTIITCQTELEWVKVLP